MLKELTVTTARKAKAWLENTADAPSGGRRDTVAADLSAAISMWLAECASDLRLPKRCLSREKARLEASLMKTDTTNEAVYSPVTTKSSGEEHTGVVEGTAQEDALLSCPEEFCSGISEADILDSAATDSASVPSWKEVMSHSEEDISAEDSPPGEKLVTGEGDEAPREVSLRGSPADKGPKGAPSVEIASGASTPNASPMVCEPSVSADIPLQDKGVSQGARELSSSTGAASTVALINEAERPKAPPISNFGEKDAMMWFSTVVTPAEESHGEQECALTELSQVTVPASTVLAYSKNNLT